MSVSFVVVNFSQMTVLRVGSILQNMLVRSKDAKLWDRNKRGQAVVLVLLGLFLLLVMVTVGGSTC